jgi:hypothetical protein
MAIEWNGIHPQIKNHPATTGSVVQIGEDESPSLSRNGPSERPHANPNPIHEVYSPLRDVVVHRFRIKDTMQISYWPCQSCG